MRVVRRTKEVNGIDLDEPVSRRAKHPTWLEEKGEIDAERLLSSVRILESANESSGDIVEERLGLHPRTILTVAQGRLEWNLGLKR